MASTKKVATVRARAKYRCEYCLTAERLCGYQFETDHIEPKSRGGSDDTSNLCLACRRCNGLKSDRLFAIDPKTERAVQLFNPRQQMWKDHFRWEQDGQIIAGITASGRATIELLEMNHPLIVEARKIWIMVNRHPPSL